MILSVLCFLLRDLRVFFSCLKTKVALSVQTTLRILEMPTQSTAKIDFQFESACTLKHRTALKDFISSLFHKEGKSLASLTYVFCSDAYLLELNRSYLQHDYFTDIITFDLSENKKQIIGEIYISIDRVRDNATTVGVSFNNELHRLIFHGALHLCGYKDKSAREKTAMTAAEDKYLALYFS